MSTFLGGFNLFLLVIYLCKYLLRFNYGKKLILKSNSAQPLISCQGRGGQILILHYKVLSLESNTVPKYILDS